MAHCGGARRAAAGALRLAVLAVGLSPAAAHAGGFATARFGGEHGTAADVRPSALYYNPGAIGLLDGQQLMLDGAFVLRSAGYERFPEAINASTLDAVESAGYERQAGVDALAGNGTLTNVVALPFVGAVSDLGMSRSPLRLGAAFFVPFGGQSSWDEEPQNPTFPGASDGPARWYVIEGTIRSFAVALGAAFRIEAARLALGVTGNLYIAEVNTVRARNANATDNLVSPNGALSEGRSLLDVSQTVFGLGAGVLWEPIAKTLWLGLSYQSQPGFGTMELKGTLDNTLGTANPAEPVDVIFTEELPDIFRLAGRVRPSPSTELRLEVRWERWSELEQMCLVDAGVDDVDAACETRPDGSLVNDQYNSDVVQIFDRDWDDTWGVRASFSYFVDPDGEVFLGAGFDSSAIPDRTLDPSLFDMDKLSLAVGGSYRMGLVTLSLTLTDVIYFERDTRGVPGNEVLESPSRQPTNTGLFTQNAFILQPAAELSF